MFKQRTIKLIDNFFSRYEKMSFMRENLEKAVTILTKCVVNGNKILVCGNGGSCADSEHIAGEFNKSFMLERKISREMQEKLYALYPDQAEYFIQNLQSGIPTIPLVSMTGFLTAYINDCSADMMFAQGVNTFGKDGDILIGISTSGNSKNVVNAFKIAKTLNVKTISLTGESGGKLKDLSSVCLNTPSNIVYEVQEYHLPIYHILCLATESEVFEK